MRSSRRIPGFAIDDDEKDLFGSSEVANQLKHATKVTYADAEPTPTLKKGLNISWRKFFALRARLRQSWEDDENEEPADWVDLFYDLFFVAAAVGLSGVVADSDLSLWILVVGSLYGLAFFASWLFLCMVRSAIHFDGNSFVFLMMANMIFLLAAASEEDPTFVQRYRWCIWRLLVYATHGILLLSAYIQICDARRWIIYLGSFCILLPSAAHITIVSLQVLASGVVGDDVQIALTVVLEVIALVLEIWALTSFSLIPWVAERIRMPRYNIHHILERFELLVMVTLGEALIAILYNTAGRSDLYSLLNGFLYTFITCGFAVENFAFQPMRAQDHATSTRLRGFLFLNLSVPTNASILGYGCAVKAALRRQASAFVAKTDELVIDATERESGAIDPSMDYLPLHAQNVVTCCFCMSQVFVIASGFTHRTKVATRYKNWNRLMLAIVCTPLWAGVAFATSDPLVRSLIMASNAFCLVLLLFWREAILEVYYHDYCKRKKKRHTVLRKHSFRQPSMRTQNSLGSGSSRKSTTQKFQITFCADGSTSSSSEDDEPVLAGLTAGKNQFLKAAKRMVILGRLKKDSHVIPDEEDVADVAESDEEQRRQDAINSVSIREVKLSESSEARASLIDSKGPMRTRWQRRGNGNDFVVGDGSEASRAEGPMRALGQRSSGNDIEVIVGDVAEAKGEVAEENEDSCIVVLGPPKKKGIGARSSRSQLSGTNSSLGKKRLGKDPEKRMRTLNKGTSRESAPVCGRSFSAEPEQMTPRFDRTHEQMALRRVQIGKRIVRGLERGAKSPDRGAKSPDRVAKSPDKGKPATVVSEPVDVESPENIVSVRTV